MTGAPRVGVTRGSGHAPPALIRLLERSESLAVVPLVDPALPPAGLALVVEAGGEGPPDADAATQRIGILLRSLPAGVPVVALVEERLVAELAPPARTGGRLLGLHLVHAGDEAGRPPLAELVVPAGADPVIADGILDLLAGAGVEAVPCGDQPGRVVRRLEQHLAEVRRVVHAAGRVDAETIDLLLVNEAYRAADDGAAGADDLDRLVVGAGIRAEGPFAFAGRLGLRRVVTELHALARAAEERGDRELGALAAPAPLLWRIATV